MASISIAESLTNMGTAEHSGGGRRESRYIGITLPRGNSMDLLTPVAARLIAVVLLLCVFASATVFATTPVEYANPLVGTASLDKPELLGNAPPPGEEAYTGFVFPGPGLPHRNILLGPINKDLTEAAGNHGIIYPYIHSRPTMIGFSGPGLTIMPLAGDWTVPPDRSYASPYDKASEKASPGYYSVFFPIAEFALS